MFYKSIGGGGGKGGLLNTLLISGNFCSSLYETVSGALRCLGPCLDPPNIWIWGGMEREGSSSEQWVAAPVDPAPNLKCQRFNFPAFLCI